MNATRTEPRVHCYQRRMQGAYVPAASTTTEHLAAVFAAERERIAAEAAKPRRRRRVQTEPTEVQPQLRLA